MHIYRERESAGKIYSHTTYMCTFMHVWIHSCVFVYRLEMHPHIHTHTHVDAYTRQHPYTA